MTTRAAAMISPVGEDVIEAMRIFGYHLGMAFQIVDDVLDFTGAPAELGKPVGSDLLQGLVTLPTLYYLELHPDDQNAKALMNGGYLLAHGAAEALVDSVSRSEGIPLALQEANVYIEKALEQLSLMPDVKERKALEELARYTVNRKL